ncbi:MAG: cytochrome c biogenesis protein CcsA [Chloroflexi bacterium]|nr:cytochrome c biogenesis protein CcsA [Chloroflexota bacterium]
MEQQHPGQEVQSRTKTATRKLGDTLRTALLLLSAVFLVADLALIFLWVPVERVTRELFQIFYFHVPLAMASFLAFFVTFLASSMYLWKRTTAWDALGHASAEVGVLFMSLVLITGSIWAKPANGVWWTWDPRLTTSLILWLIYLGYLMIRAYASNPSQARRFAAVVGIVGFVDVPIVYFSAVWWRNEIHPNLYMGPLAEPDALDSRMFMGFMFSMVTFLLLYCSVLWQRVSLRRSEDALHTLRLTENIQGGIS